jgi:hypothetical protein
LGEKFGRDRHRPSGAWIQATGLLDVVGVQHRKAEALAFARAVQTAEQKGWPYGVRLEREPFNRYDPNAIKVIGHAHVKPLFGAPSERSWHIGYVPREVAEELVEDLFSQNHPCGAELYGVYVGRDFIDIEFFVLVPKGSPGATRTARRHASTASGPTPPLTDEQRQLLKSRQLGLYRNTRLTQAESLKRMGDYGGALDMYLRVAWLDQNGPGNVGLTDGKPFGGIPAFDRAHVLVAPGIVGAIAQGANSLGIDFPALRERFITCGQREIAAIAPLQPIITHEMAWAGFETDLKAAVDSGTRWRKPKGA